MSSSYISIILLLLELFSSKHAHGFAQQRKSWNPFRFVQQSSKFVQFNPIRALTDTNQSKKIMPGELLWIPQSGSSSMNSQNSFTFSPLDDVVMGGVSLSNFDDKTGIWKGTVTDENNGGFIGIRSTPFKSRFDMEECQGIEFKIRSIALDNAVTNEKRRIKFSLRDSEEFNGITWASSKDIQFNKRINNMANKNSNITVFRLPFQKQIPTRFARTVPDQTFQKNVVGIQLTYSKFEYDGNLNPNFDLGDISLQILEIRSY